MLKKWLVVVSLFASFSGFAAEFTADHFETLWSGSSRSEDIPEYCKFHGLRSNDDGNISFKMNFEYNGDPLVSFYATSGELTEQIVKQGSFVTLKNDNEQIQVNFANYNIVNFSYLKTDASGKIVRQFTCSNR